MDDLNNLTAVQLLEHAEAEMSQLPPNLDRADKFLTAAYAKDNKNINIVNALAQFTFENSTTEDPTVPANLLRQSIELDPKGSSWRYMYLGQLAEGKEAVKFFTEGAKIAESDANKKKGEVCSFYTAMVELYMTDLCDEPDAQKNCEQCLEKAFGLEPENFEVLSTLALYNKTIGEVNKGQEFAQKACDSLEKERKAIEEYVKTGDYELTNDEKDAKLNAMEADLPQPEQQVSLVRSLIDLQMGEPAEIILNDLLELDDEDVQIWFLLGMTACVRNDKEEGEHCLERAVFCCQKHGLEGVWEEHLTSLQTRIAGIKEDATVAPGSSNNNKKEALNTSECSTAGPAEMTD